MYSPRKSILWIFVVMISLSTISLQHADARPRPRHKKVRHFNKTAALQEIQNSLMQEVVPLKEIEISTC